MGEMLSSSCVDERSAKGNMALHLRSLDTSELEVRLDKQLYRVAVPLNAFKHSKVPVLA
jgi:hypothetical protein